MRKLFHHDTDADYLAKLEEAAASSSLCSTMTKKSILRHLLH